MHMRSVLLGFVVLLAGGALLELGWGYDPISSALAAPRPPQRAMTADGLLDARSFGVTADGLHDDSRAIQNAIDFAISDPECAGVLLPRGTCRLTSPLKIWPRSPRQQPQVILRGAAYPAGVAGGGHETILRAEFGNAPILSVQSGRGVVIDSIVFEGPLHRNWQPTYEQVFNPKNFTQPGVRDSRYSPQCGICFDPLGRRGAPPDGGYPGFPYLQKLNGSSDCVVRHCVIQNCVVGIVTDPCGGNSNSSELLFERVRISACKIAYASGGTQAKVVNFRDALIGQVYTAFDTVSYGCRTGRPPQLVSGGSITFSARIADYSTCYGGTEFEGVYAESLGALGTFGSTPCEAMSVSSFSGCDLLFNAVRGVPIPTWLTARQEVLFAGTTISTDHLLRAENGPVTLSRTRFNSYGVNLPELIKWAAPAAVSRN